MLHRFALFPDLIRWTEKKKKETSPLIHLETFLFIVSGCRRVDFVSRFIAPKNWLVESSVVDPGHAVYHFSPKELRRDIQVSFFDIQNNPPRNLQLYSFTRQKKNQKVRFRATNFKTLAMFLKIRLRVEISFTI